MKIGLLFGSFNPIHTGHLMIASFFTNYEVDKVWFVVSPQNPFKKETDLLNFSDRFKLVKIAIGDNELFVANDSEYRLSKPSYTIHTLNLFTKNYMDDEFFLIMGSDNLENLHSWKDYESIINNYQILVYERPGFNFPKSQQNKNIRFFKTPLLELSSSLIRKMIKENKSIRYLVPESVRNEILVKGYFK